MKKQHDHSITYRSNNLLHFTHRKRLLECAGVINEMVEREARSGIVYDLGGASGFLIDYLNASQFTNFEQQLIFDLEHPENNSKKVWYKPTIVTKYITADLNRKIQFPERINPRLIVISETLEHLAKPSATIIDIKNYCENKDMYLYASFPRETGATGFLKFVLRLLSGRNLHKGFSYNIKYFFWVIGMMKDLRETKSFYADHDGFNDKELLIFFTQLFSKKDIFVKKGFSTIHILIKFSAT
jgi:hypothetical protein